MARGDFARHRAEIVAGDVGRQADLPLHVVAIELAGHRARRMCGHVAQQNLAVLGPLERNLAQILGESIVRIAIRRADDRPRNLDLHLIADARFRDRASSSARRTGWTTWR